MINNPDFLKFIKSILKRHGWSMRNLAGHLGVNVSTVSRWMNGKCVPDIDSCCRLAKLESISTQDVLSMAGYIPKIPEKLIEDWPSFREYVHYKFGDELDEDIIIMLDTLLHRLRNKSDGTK